MVTRKGIYFSIDAILFAGIIAVVLGVTYSLYISPPQNTAATYYASDISRVFSSLTVSESTDPSIVQLIAQGEITHLNNTILDQIGEFWAAGKDNLARNLLANLTSGLLPPHYGIGVWVDNEEIFLRNSSALSMRTLVSSQNVISGFSKNKPTRGYTAKVYYSGATNRVIESYGYFGGYVGDGTITQYLWLPDSFTAVAKASMEFVVSSGFTLYINDIASGTYQNQMSSELRADSYNISQAYFANFRQGRNSIRFEFLNSSQFIGGGFILVTVNSSDISYLPDAYDGTTINRTILLSGIDGVVNSYSSFSVPGTLTSITLDLNYSTNYPLFVTLGNVTVYDSDVTGDVIISISNATLLSYFKNDTGRLSNKTIPLRIGHFSTDIIGDLGAHTDTFILTDVSTSMDTADVSDAPGESRLDVAKSVEKNFVDFVLNSSLENRIGLVSYHSSVEPGQSQDLTNNNITLKNKIDGYKTKSGNTCFSCAIKFARDKLEDDGNTSKRWSMTIMSDGTADKCDAIPQAQCTPQAAKDEAIQYACDAYQDLNISIYAIGYGAGADNVTLKNISEDCSDGKFFHSDNKTQLQEAFHEIGEEILSISFSYQKTVAQGVTSKLSEGSQLRIQYVPTVPPYTFGKLPVTVQSEPFGNNITSANIEILPGVSITDAVVTSYSGDLWTERVKINSNTIFNLSSYNVSYVEIGDPFQVYVPPQLLGSGMNTITVQSAAGPLPGQLNGGSPDDRIIYTMLLPNSGSYSSVASEAAGCRWLVKYNDETTATIVIPQSYTGTENCNYEQGTYPANDAIAASSYQLLGSFDLDDDGILDVSLDTQGLRAESLVIDDIPSLWGPAVIEVRVWD